MSLAVPPVSAPAPSSASLATQQANLAKLVATYKSDIQKGQDPAQLKSLAQQITAVAKSLGQNVSLPRPSASSSGATAIAANPPTADKPSPGYA
jgi:hypothetical protein